MSDYIILSCILFIALFIIFNDTNIKIINLFKIIAVIVAVESVICLLQYANIIQSQNHFFKVTGTWENPNVTAIFLAMAMPIILTLLFSSQGAFKIYAATIFILLIYIAFLLSM